MAVALSVFGGVAETPAERVPEITIPEPGNFNMPLSADSLGAYILNLIG